MSSARTGCLHLPNHPYPPLHPRLTPHRVASSIVVACVVLKLLLEGHGCGSFGAAEPCRCVWVAVSARCPPRWSHRCCMVFKLLSMVLYERDAYRPLDTFCSREDRQDERMSRRRSRYKGGVTRGREELPPGNSTMKRGSPTTERAGLKSNMGAGEI